MAKKETWLKFGKESEPIYSELNKRAFGNKLDSIHLFMLAMTYGYSKQRRVTDFARAANGPRTNIRAEHLAFMTAIQVATTGPEANILDHESRDKIAEEYAEGGILLLNEAIADPNIPSFTNWFILEVATKFQ